MAIVNGSHDSLQPIRDYMFDNGIWERPEGSPESSLASGIDDVDDALDDIDDDDFSDGDFDPSDFVDEDVMSED